MKYKLILLTKEIRKRLPKRQNVKNAGDYIAYARFFLVCGQWTWYACEFDGEDIFFGFVIGIEPEFGPFSLRELKSLHFTFKSAGENVLVPVMTDNPKSAPAVERDRFFKPTALKNIPEVAEHLYL